MQVMTALADQSPTHFARSVVRSLWRIDDRADCPICGLAYVVDSPSDQAELAIGNGTYRR